MHAFCPLWVFLRSGLAVPKAVARKPLPQKVSALDPSIRNRRPARCDITGLRSHLTFDRLRGLRKRTLVRDVSSSESNYEKKTIAEPLYCPEERSKGASCAGIKIKADVCKQQRVIYLFIYCMENTAIINRWMHQ